MIPLFCLFPFKALSNLFLAFLDNQKAVWCWNGDALHLDADQDGGQTDDHCDQADVENACQGGGETDAHFDPTGREAGCQGGVGDDEQAGGEVDSPGDQSDGQAAEHGVCQGLGETETRNWNVRNVTSKRK